MLASTNFQRVECFQFLNPFKIADVGRCKGVTPFKTGRGDEGVTQGKFLSLAQLDGDLVASGVR